MTKMIYSILWRTKGEGTRTIRLHTAIDYRSQFYMRENKSFQKACRKILMEYQKFGFNNHKNIVSIFSELEWILRNKTKNGNQLWYEDTLPLFPSFSVKKPHVSSFLSFLFSFFIVVASNLSTLQISH